MASPSNESDFVIPDNEPTQPATTVALSSESSVTTSSGITDQSCEPKHSSSCLENDPEDATNTISYHPLFYIRDGMAEVQVENVMFRIPQYLLTRHSEHFKIAFHNLRPAPDTQAFRLEIGEGIKADHFANLLQVINPPNYRRRIPLTTVSEWTSVLDLATRWGFEDIRELAIEHLTDIACPVDKIALARSYDVNHWLVDAYVAVCERTEALSLAEAKHLPLEDVVNIGAARQALRGGFRPFVKSRSTILHTLSIKEEIGTPNHSFADYGVPSGYIHPPKLLSPPADRAVSHDANEHFSSAYVMDFVVDGLALLLERNSQSHTNGENEIVAAVQHCDMRPRTLRSILTLAIDKGLAVWSDEPNNPGSRCASVCNEISRAVESDLKDSSLSHEDGNSLTGRDLIAHYITAICQERCDWTSISAGVQLDNVISQAGFFGELYSYQLLSVRLIEAWWIQLQDVYNQTIAMDISRLRYIHAFLVSVGRLIDVPAVGDLSDAIFRHLSSRHRYDDWDAVQPEIMGLITLRTKRWIGE